MSTTKPITLNKIDKLKSEKANDSEVVHLADIENITGEKTFKADTTTFNKDVVIHGELTGSTISATTFTGNLSGTASNATNDSANNNIVNTYAKKSQFKVVSSLPNPVEANTFYFIKEN